MYFRITAQGADLIEPGNVQAFHATVPADLPFDVLEAGVARAGLGTLLPDGEHLMVRVETIRQMASGRVGPGWDEDLAGMLGYAASKGWTDEAGAHVRAHIERE